MPQRGMQAASHCQNTQEAQLAGSLIPTDQTRVDRLPFYTLCVPMLCCVWFLSRHSPKATLCFLRPRYYCTIHYYNTPPLKRLREASSLSVPDT